MSFDIKIHIKDHAKLIIDNLEILKNETDFVHFTCSVDTGLLIGNKFDTQKKIDDVMIKMLKEISSIKLVVTEKNGKYTNKYNQVVQRYRERIIPFDTLLSAYHNRHFDNSKSVNPHFHFLGNKNVRLGLNFTYLKQAINKVSFKYGLTFHFADACRETGLTKKQEASVKSMSWLFNEGNKEKIIHYLSDESRIKKNLDLLYTHYLHSENISYFLKVMSIVNERLSELDIDYWYKDINLKESICFSLTKEQIDIVEALKNEEEVDLDSTKVFDREVLKYSHGFGSDSMSIIVDKFDIPKIDSRKLTIKLSKQINMHTNKKSNFKDLILLDVNNAIDNAQDEKELKDLMVDMGYTKVSFKTSKTKDEKRKKTGLTIVTNKQMKMTLTFNELDKNWSGITRILIENQKKKKKKVVPESHIKSYKRKKTDVEDNLKFFRYKVRLLLTIYCNVKEERKKVEYLANYFDVVRSEMYNITTFTSEDTTISDYGDKIVLKKSISLQDSVADMLKLVDLKGWNLDSISIKGDTKFIEESERQIKQLKRIVKVKKKSVINSVPIPNL